MAQTRTHGERVFTAPDVDRLRLIGLMMRNNISGERTASFDFAVSLFIPRRLRASKCSHINRERRWRYGYCPKGCCPDLKSGDAADSTRTASPARTDWILGHWRYWLQNHQLAAMVGHLNQHADKHILTLEDPIEYRYTSALPDTAVVPPALRHFCRRAARGVT